MLWTISVVLLILWLVGLVSQLTLGGLIHLLVVSALIALSASIVQVRRPRYVPKPIRLYSKNKR